MSHRPGAVTRLAALVTSRYAPGQVNADMMAGRNVRGVVIHE